MTSVPRRSMASEAAALALGSLFTQGAALVSVIVLARLLDKPELGSYQQLILVYAIVTPLLLGGVPAAIQYFVPREKEEVERRRWIFDAYVTLGGLGLLAALLIVALRHPIADALGNEELDGALAAYAPFVFCSFVSAVMPNALIVEGRARAASALGVVGSAVAVGAVVAAAALAGDIESIALAASAASAVMMVVNTAVVARVVGIERPRALGEIRARHLLGFGLPLAITGIVSILGFQFDRLVVARTFSPERFAVYAVGAIEVPIAMLIRQSMNSVLVPALSERHAAGDIAGMAELWRGSMRKAALVILPLFAFLMTLAPEVVRALFGGRYAESADIFRVYLFLMPITMMTWGLLPMAAGRPGINIGGSIVMLAINGGLAVALVGPLGLFGPAMATPLALLGVASYFIFRIRRLLGVTVSELIPWRALTRTLAISLACAAPLLALHELALPDVVRLAIGAPVFAVGCVLWLRRAGQIDDLDWGRLTGIIGSVRRTVFGAA